MKINRLQISLATLMLTQASAGAQADESRAEQLERKLQERDRVIIELLERVETLERRVGVQNGTRSSSGTRETSLAGQTGQSPAQPVEKSPGTVAVTEADAERALERSLTLAGALLLPAGVLEIEPGLRYTRREDNAPAFVTSDGDLFAAQTDLDSDTLSADLTLRLGLPWDSQLEIGIPYRWRQIETVTQVGFTPTDSSELSGSGFGDLRLGVAKTLLREDLWRPDLVGRLTWDTDTGNRADNGVPLGGGFHELRASLSATKRQDPIAFVGSLAYEYVFEDDHIKPGATISASFGSYIALSPETSLSLLFAGAYQQETELSNDRISGSDRTIGSLILGGSTLLSRGTLLNLSVGIGLTDDADDFSIMLSLPMRFDQW